MLRAIMEASFTPDDNDLHLSNLVDTPILAIHGYVQWFNEYTAGHLIPFPACSGDDENVPVWHTREAVSVLKSWSPSAKVVCVAMLNHLSNITCIFLKLQGRLR